MKEPSRLLVAGGTVVGHRQRVRADVLIEGERVVALAEPGTLSAPRTLDATGLYVLPGLVDAHVHVRDPGYVHKEDFGTAGMAAVAGGVTSILVMPYDDPLTNSGPAVKAKAQAAIGRSHAHFGIQGAVGPGNVRDVAELVQAGAVSLEVQMAEAPAALGSPDHHQLLEIFKAAHTCSAVVGVYCEDAALVAGRSAALQSAGRRDPAAFAESKSAIGEALTVGAVAALALEAEARVHLRQLSTAGGLKLASSARMAGADLSIEVTPHHLSLTLDDEVRGGPDLKVSPPLRSPEDLHALRGALLEGAIDIVATDHAPHAPEEKRAGRDDIWLAPGGFPGLETLFPVMFELLGVEGLEALVRLCSHSPAVRFGLPRKGAVLPGYDADLILVDPAAEWVPKGPHLHTRARSTPYEGRHFRGDVRLTIVAGEIVSEERRVVADPRGKWLVPARLLASA